MNWKQRQVAYGRTIGKVSVDEVDCGLQIIEKGLAWHYKAYAKEQPESDRISYARAEESARSAGIGLWVDPSPQAPWLFRHPSDHK